MARQLNQASIDLLKTNEGCELTAYLDTVGVWTIGYGFTFPIDGVAIHSGMTITQEKADQVLQETIPQYQNFLTYFNRDFNDNQVGALTSFEWNLGKYIWSVDNWDKNATDQYMIDTMNLYHIPPEVTARRNREVAFYQLPSGTTPNIPEEENGTSNEDTENNPEEIAPVPEEVKTEITLNNSDIYISNGNIYQVNNGLILRQFNNHFKPNIIPLEENQSGNDSNDEPINPPQYPDPPVTPSEPNSIIEKFMSNARMFEDGFGSYEQIRPQLDIPTCGWSDCSGFVGWCLRDIHPVVWNGGYVNTSTIYNTFKSGGFIVTEGSLQQCLEQRQVGDILDMSSTSPFGYGDHVCILDGDYFWHSTTPWGSGGGIFKASIDKLQYFGFTTWVLIRIV